MKDEQDVFTAIREQLSPHAIAAIAAYLQPAKTNDPDVDRQIAWFRDGLIEMLGGPDQHDALAEEMSL